jgi:8-oxo-dGTP pyrophosphatase MutT (NUDIX family)
VDELRRRLTDRLAHARPQTLALPGFARAAVLLPILARPDGPALLFTLRTETVKHHPGQISFPGGRIEPGEDPPGAALREAEEEVGLPPASVEIVGSLDDRISIARFVVTPLVGLVAHPPAAFTRQESEVLEPFEVPLARLCDPAHHRLERFTATAPPPGWTVDEITSRSELFELDAATNTYPVSFYDGGDNHIIWGLTARILRQLLELLA